MSEAPKIIWQDKEGNPLSCLEKVRVLRENDAELRQVLQDAFEDGILMGATADSMLRSFEAALKALKDPTVRSAVCGAEGDKA